MPPLCQETQSLGQHMLERWEKMGYQEKKKTAASKRFWKLGVYVYCTLGEFFYYSLQIEWNIVTIFLLIMYQTVTVFYNTGENTELYHTRNCHHDRGDSFPFDHEPNCHYPRSDSFLFDSFSF